MFRYRQGITILFLILVVNIVKKRNRVLVNFPLLLSFSTLFQIKMYKVIMKYNETRENLRGGIHRGVFHMKCIRWKIFEQIGIGWYGLSSRIGMAYLHVLVWLIFTFF